MRISENASTNKANIHPTPPEQTNHTTLTIFIWDKH